LQTLLLACTCHSRSLPEFVFFYYTTNDDLQSSASGIFFCFFSEFVYYAEIFVVSAAIIVQFALQCGVTRQARGFRAAIATIKAPAASQTGKKSEILHGKHQR
jgi:hypothetical protein